MTITEAGRGNAPRNFQMDSIKQAHDYLKSKRELDMDTLKSTIHVNSDYHDYIRFVADALSIDADACLEAFQALEAHEAIHIMPQMQPHIDFIEVV